MIRDIGSIFYNLKKDDLENARFTSANPSFLVNNFHFFYSGRHAIFSILNHIEKSKSIDKIWLPSYFCHNVINSVRSRYANVHFYETHPVELDLDLNPCTFASKDDVVVLNNYWGIGTFSDYSEKNSRPTIIEDHSHAWLTANCIQSKADYCIASIRKSYPIPLGAVVWRPLNELFNPNYESDHTDSIFKAYQSLLKAQELKRSYLKEDKLEFQKMFLELVNKGEKEVNDSRSIIKPDENLLAIIKSFMTLDPNTVKRRNLEYALKNLVSSKHFQILTRPGFTPFGLLLNFPDEMHFNNFKSQMISKNIYPALLWSNNNHDRYGYIVNIHLDFRYNERDMDYLVKKINAWIALNG